MIEDPIIIPNCLKHLRSIPIIRLPEPNTSKAGLFIINQAKIYQIQSLQSKHQNQSWFLKSNDNENKNTKLIKDQVISKNAGRILLVIEINPIFLILNLFLQSSINLTTNSFDQKYKEFEELIESLLLNWKFLKIESKEEEAEEEIKPIQSDLNLFQSFLIQNQTYFKSITDVLILNDQEEESQKLYRISLKKVKELINKMIEKISISLQFNDQRDFLNQILIENDLNEIYETNQDLKPKINQMISLRLLESYLPISFYKEIQKDYEFKEIEIKLKSIQDLKQDLSSNPNFNEFIGLKSISKPNTSTTNLKKKKVLINENQVKPTGMKTLSSFWKPSESSSKDISKKQNDSSK